jgi:septum formation protein
VAGPPLVLASRSPQRRAILSQLGVDFAVHISDVDELTEGEPATVALENSRLKATTVAARMPDARVLGVDTLVTLDGNIYGKPVDAVQAGHTLRVLSGRTHTVVSGVCLIERGRERSVVARTQVEFRDLSEPLLEWYLASEEWRERAGGYAIQGRGAALVARIDGDYWNVVGLPVAALLELVPGVLV